MLIRVHISIHTLRLPSDRLHSSMATGDEPSGHAEGVLIRVPIQFLHHIGTRDFLPPTGLWLPKTG